MNEIALNERDPASLPAAVSRIEHAIAVATTPDEMKQVLALTDAAIAFAKRYYGEQKDMIRQAKGLRVQAERKLGDILAAMPKATGTRSQLAGRDSSGGAKSEPPETFIPRLADIGIDKKTSARAQQLAVLAKTDPAAFQAAAAGDVSVSVVLRKRESPRRPAQKTKAADARRAALAEAQENHVSMFATYARLALKELNAGRELSSDEIRLAQELADACVHVVRNATALIAQSVKA